MGTIRLCMNRQNDENIRFINSHDIPFFDKISLDKRRRTMAKKHTLEELSNCSKEELITLVLMMQGQLEALNENIEKLIEQVRLANSYRFGKHTETLDSIDGQLSFFDEAECFCDLQVSEPTPEEVLSVKQSKKKKGKREMDLKGFPEEILPSYSVSVEELDTFYGQGNWRRLPDETFKRLRHEPESWTVEVHTVEVYVGTDGDHQDEFLRGKRPKDLLRNSIVTPSLLASILNVKYVNSSALHRIEQEFERNGVNISRQTMSNWIEKKLPNVTNANCWAHARRSFADAVKIADKKDPKTVKQSVAYQALQKIGEFYTIDTELKMLSSQERLQKRQDLIKPLVEEFFAWVKEQIEQCSVPPKSKTEEGLRFIINQEKYLRVFLEDGDVPIDNSASERAIRTFCLGKKNWMFHNTANGAAASALVYSISETAKLNHLRPYYYFKYILTELPNFCDKQGNIDSTKLDDLMPWSDKLPEECRKPRR